MAKHRILLTSGPDQNASNISIPPLPLRCVCVSISLTCNRDQLHKIFDPTDLSNREWRALDVQADCDRITVMVAKQMKANRRKIKSSHSTNPSNPAQRDQTAEIPILKYV